MGEMTYEASGLVFRWNGGQYIDVYKADEEYPRECINVMSMDGELHFEFGDWTAFIAECEEWLNGTVNEIP